MRGNKRRYDRYAAAGFAQISWITTSGEPRLQRVRCLDVSERGLRVQCSEMIPLRASVTVQPESEFIKVPGQGSVRYCARSRGSYEVGLEFADSLKFQPSRPLAVV